MNPSNVQSPAGNPLLRYIYHPADAQATRQSKLLRTTPLSEDDMPSRNPADTVQDRIDALYRIVDYLDVENSPRYAPGSVEETYCNIYARDYCYLAGAYLPNLWWRPEAIADLLAGRPVDPDNSSNLKELDAFDAYQWLEDWGHLYGWVRVDNVTALQRAANEGRVAIIAAPRKGDSHTGHIVAVMPETAEHHAVWEEDRVVYPLQSQAGLHNKKLNPGEWMVRHADAFIDFGYWHHD